MAGAIGKILATTGRNLGRFAVGTLLSSLLNDDDAEALMSLQSKGAFLTFTKNEEKAFKDMIKKSASTIETKMSFRIKILDDDIAFMTTGISVPIEINHPDLLEDVMKRTGYDISGKGNKIVYAYIYKSSINRTTYKNWTTPLRPPILKFLEKPYTINMTIVATKPTGLFKPKASNAAAFEYQCEPTFYTFINASESVNTVLASINSFLHSERKPVLNNKDFLSPNTMKQFCLPCLISFLQEFSNVKGTGGYTTTNDNILWSIVTGGKVPISATKGETIAKNLYTGLYNTIHHQVSQATASPHFQP